jgi:TonB family protein
MDKSTPGYFGRYKVLEKLGSGGMGVVYVCKDPHIGRRVAVKVLKDPEALSPVEREKFQARFRREGEAAGRLNHPDIVHIYDVAPSYIVMELLEGRSLSALLRTGVVLSVKNAVALVMRVADALDYAHRNGVAHRDIKPSNIMLVAAGGVKVMDFGVARLDTSELTSKGTVVGSVRYMAPEQMMGQRVDGRADVFSLGAVAYELLTGRPPFPGKNVTEVVSRVMQGSHVPPAQVDSRFPTSLNDVFATVFAPKPQDRYAKAIDFARGLYQATRPVEGLEVRHQRQHPAAGRIGATPTPSPRSGERLLGGAPSHGQREGFLILDSDPPGAQIYVDGNPAGAAPLPGLDVEFGRHVIRMEVEGRDPVSAPVEVSPARPLQVVTFTLPAPTEGDSLKPGQFVPFGPEVSPPRRLSGALPSYPEGALERGLEGAPAVEVWVSETGDVIDVAIVESAGAILDGALLQAVAGWRFSPATLRGVPVSVGITVRHVFRR